MNTLKFYRLQSGLTMKELAEKAGISQSTYSYIEKGEITASEDVVKKVCEALSISAERIFFPARFGIRELSEVNLNV